MSFFFVPAYSDRPSIKYVTYVLITNLFTSICSTLILDLNYMHTIFHPFFEYNNTTNCLWNETIHFNRGIIFKTLNIAELIVIILLMVSSLVFVNVYICIYIIALRQTKREYIKNDIPSIFLNQHVPHTSCLYQQFAVTSTVPNHTEQYKINHLSNLTSYHFPQINDPFRPHPQESIVVPVGLFI